MKQLVDKLPRSDNVLFVFYDFETTQDTKFNATATEHVQIWFACYISVRNVKMKAI
jgi:hypothetical protein